MKDQLEQIQIDEKSGQWCQKRLNNSDWRNVYTEKEDYWTPEQKLELVRQTLNKIIESLTEIDRELKNNREV
jgi:DNA polymerase III delta subunit